MRADAFLEMRLSGAFLRAPHNAALQKLFLFRTEMVMGLVCVGLGFSDWALRSRLDCTEAVNVFKLFDELEQALQADVHGIVERLKRKLHRIVNHERFRREFEYFLKDHDLPTDLSHLSARWIPARADSASFTRRRRLCYAPKISPGTARGRRLP